LQWTRESRAKGKKTASKKYGWILHPSIGHANRARLWKRRVNFDRENAASPIGPWIASYIDVHYTYLASLPEGDFDMNASALHHDTLQAVAAHVLRHLARAQVQGRPVRLDELARAIGVRKDDVRHVVTRLHNEGHVDVRRMRVTMTGLALAISMRECKLHDLRERRRSTDTAAAVA
jgi:hypothetical protein